MSIVYSFKNGLEARDWNADSLGASSAEFKFITFNPSVYLNGWKKLESAAVSRQAPVSRLGSGYVRD